MKVYWIADVEAMMDKKIHHMMDTLAADTDMTPEQKLERLAMIRTCRQFEKSMISSMRLEEAQEEEARKPQQEGEQNDNG